MAYTDSEPTHAGCVVGASDAAAGCVAAPDEESRQDQQPAPVDARAGCADSTPPEMSPGQAHAPATVREFERALRGLGFTRSQAEVIARSGFGALQAQPCPDPSPEEDPSITAALQALAASFKD